MSTEIPGDIPFKTLLVDAIAGAGFPTMEFAERCVKLGLAQYTGNQHNESWRWLKGELYKSMPTEELQLLYYSIKNYIPLTNPGVPA